MPPALSDEENGASSGGDEIPYRARLEPVAADNDDDDEEEVAGDDGEAEEDEYIVEEIVSHRKTKDGVEYEVKWMGYEKKSDRTWEPEENLIQGAKEVLDEYWEEIGGRPEVGKGKKRKNRKPAVDAEDPSTPASTKRVKKEKEWSPPPGSWENDVDYIETVEENTDPKTGKPARFGYIIWNNRRKTQHKLADIYQKCPQKMLQYYEQHLVFTPPGDDDVLNGDHL